MTGRLDGRSRQRSAEILLVHCDHAQARGPYIAAEPAERQLVWHGEDDQGVRGGMPVTGQIRISDGEVKSRVCRLTRLGFRHQIGTSDQVKAVRCLALKVRHIGSVPFPGLRRDTGFPRAG